MNLENVGNCLMGRKLSLEIKKRINWSCVKSAILYGSETWCLPENEMTILKRTEKQ